MSSTAKGWLGSRRKVLCGYCNTESRYDNLRRHTTNIHGKEFEIKFTVIEPKQSILSFLQRHDDVGSKNNNDPPEGEKDLVDVDVEEELVDHEPPGDKTENETDLVLQSENEDGIEIFDDSAVPEGSVKRKCEISNDDDITPAPKVNRIEDEYLDKKLGEFGEKLFKRVDERMITIEKFIKDNKDEGKKWILRTMQ